MPLRNFSIRSKLTLLLVTSSTLAVFFTCTIFYIIISEQFINSYRSSLENIASVAGENCKVALLFNVPEDAQTVVDSLGSLPSVVSVELFDGEDNLFAAYPQQANIRKKEKKISSRLRVARPILLDDQSTAGTIIVVDDMQSITQTQKASFYIILFVAFIAIVASYFLATFFKDVISRPLTILTKASERLAKGDFRSIDSVEVTTKDEIGVLSSSFIEMGHQLEKSQNELEEYSQTLEDRVIQRTKQLNKTITELKESQSQLIQSEKMSAMGVLVAGVAHDINNNINFISGIIPSVSRLTKQLAEQRQSPTAEGNSSHTPQYLYKQIIELLHSAEEGVRRTSRIIDDLNTFSRPTSGMFTPVNIHEELNKILRFIDSELKDRITVTKQFSNSIPEIYCLPDQLNQVFTNILLNAAQAIEDTGTIDIKTWNDDSVVYIRFLDDGHGISADIIEQVFDPFFTTKEVGKGTGLGLSISYSIIQSHNGDISVTSKVNEGTEVLLHLPISFEVTA